MALSAIKVKKAKPADKAYKLTDERGLYLRVQPNGSKYWRFDYRISGRRKTLALGVYPDVSLAKARERHQKARSQLADGIDPSLAQKADREAAAGADTFEAVAREWHAKQARAWTKNYSDKIIRRLECHIFPWLGRHPIGGIRAPELLDVLRRIERRGTIETAHLAKQNCGQVFRYAIATGRADRDPSMDLKGALAPVKSTGFASLKSPSAVGALLRAIDGFEGTLVVKCALQLAPPVFVRPGELRQAEWANIDFDAAEWRIPAERMKARQPHIVPLATQAIAVLREMYPVTGAGRYVFPGLRCEKKPMSENTINSALRRLGYSREEMTGHGFRSIASTLLNEQGWKSDAIERQLAHTERNSIRAAYNYAEYLPERREMMQAWADYLDSLKAQVDRPK